MSLTAALNGKRASLESNILRSLFYREKQISCAGQGSPDIEESEEIDNDIFAT